MKLQNQNVLKELNSRELNGRNPPGFRGERLHPLRSYKFFSMIPYSALEKDIFLGFTASGSLLVSYVPVFFSSDIFALSGEVAGTAQQWNLRFWRMNRPKLDLVCEVPLGDTTVIGYASHSDVEIKFYETRTTCQYVVIVVNHLDNNALIAWGNVPEMDCSDCLRPEIHCPQHQTLFVLQVPKETDFSVGHFHSCVVERGGRLVVAFHSAEAVYVVSNQTFFSRIEPWPTSYAHPSSLHSRRNGVLLMNQTVVLDDYCAMCYSSYLNGEPSKLASCLEQCKEASACESEMLHCISTSSSLHTSSCILCSEFYRHVDSNMLLPCHASIQEPDEGTLDWAARIHHFVSHSLVNKLDFKGCQSHPVIITSKIDNKGCSFTHRLPFLLENLPSLSTCLPLPWLTWISHKSISYSHHCFALFKKLSPSSPTEEEVQEAEGDACANGTRESSVVDLSYEVHNPYMLTNTKGHFYKEPSLSTSIGGAEAVFHLEELAFQIKIVSSQMDAVLADKNQSIPNDKTFLRRGNWVVNNIRFLSATCLLIVAHEVHSANTSVNSNRAANERSLSASRLNDDLDLDDGGEESTRSNWSDEEEASDNFREESQKEKVDAYVGLIVVDLTTGGWQVMSGWREVEEMEARTSSDMRDATVPALTNTLFVEEATSLNWLRDRNRMIEVKL